MKAKLTIGDWSEDGHEEYEEFVFKVNKPIEDIQKAYYNSCSLTGLDFHDDSLESDYHSIATSYRQNYIDPRAVEILQNFNLDINNYAVISEDYIEGEDDPEIHKMIFLDYSLFANLIMDFIKISLPDLIYTEASFKKSELKTIPPINGWWSPTCNEGFGYGIYQG